jgi:hypothetical protein
MVSVGSQVSDQYDVELVLQVERFRLQANRLADLLFDLGKPSRFLIEQQLDDILVREHQDSVKLELPVLTDYLAKNLETDGFRRHEETASVTIIAILAQHVLQTLASTLARHFDQAQWRHRRDLVARMIPGHRLFEHLHDTLAVFRLFHVDEIDNYDATQVP